MITDITALILGVFLGVLSSIIGCVQSNKTWQKQGFAITRTAEEWKIAAKYRKVSRSKITVWTYYFTFILLFIFVVLISMNIITKLQVVILCFSFVITLISILGMSALVSDKIIRTSK